MLYQKYKQRGIISTDMCSSIPLRLDRKYPFFMGVEQYPDWVLLIDIEIAKKVINYHMNRIKNLPFKDGLEAIGSIGTTHTILTRSQNIFRSRHNA